MKITFWGCRGSTPVSGKKYEKYGGNTTCVEVTTEGGKSFVFDSGTGIRELGNKLIKRKFTNYNLFVTHSHWDHLSGFPFFKPIYDMKNHIKIHVPHKSLSRYERAFNDLMSPFYHPMPFNVLPSKIEFVEMGEKEYFIGKVKIEIIRNNHPGVCHGYKITEGKKSFVFMTDNELFSQRPVTKFDEFVNFVRGVDLLVHDSMYFQSEMKDKQFWGHSGDYEVAKLALDGEVKKLGLFHHDPERSDSFIDRMEFRVQEKLKGSAKVFAVRQGQTIKI